MKRYALLAAVAILGLALLAVACDGDEGPQPTPTATPTPSPTATPMPTPPLQDACQTRPNPDPVTPDFQEIDTPLPGDAFNSPVTISGRIVAFEGTFQVTIFDAQGNELADTFGMSMGQADIGMLDPFTIDVEFSVSQPTPACIWVYEQSARDGSPIHVGQIPVLLLP